MKTICPGQASEIESSIHFVGCGESNLEGDCVGGRVENWSLRSDGNRNAKGRLDQGFVHGVDTEPTFFTVLVRTTDLLRFGMVMEGRFTSKIEGMVPGQVVTFPTTREIDESLLPTAQR